MRKIRKPITVVESISINEGNSFIKDLAQLFKFRLSFVVVLSSVLAYMIAVPHITFLGLAMLWIGGFAVTAAANALNQILERDYDKLMVRTAGRPVAAGRMSVSSALIAAGMLCLLGLVILSAFNPITGFLGMVALISYSFIYTPLKRLTPLAVAVGAFPGALPVIIGVTAATGEITALAASLFAIQFLWQFAHFWAIAWLADDDYKKAGFYLLPGREGKKDSSVGWNSFLYSILLVPFSFLPWVFGLSTLLSGFIAALLAVWYCYMAYNFAKEANDASARKLMFSSFVYLPMVLIVFLMDKIVF